MPASSAPSSIWRKARQIADRTRHGTRALLNTVAHRDESEGALGRHGVMLGSLVVLLAALPFGQVVSGWTPEFPVLLGLVMIASVFVVNSQQRWIFSIALAFGVLTVGGIVYSEVWDDRLVRVTAEFLGFLLLGFTTLVMFNSLVRTDHVSQDTIVGGICVFLQIGLCFTLVFVLATEFNPGTFLEEGQPIVRSEADPSAHARTLLYYSFVTLTTLGYGDVTPRGDIARMFAVGEALIGQLYLVVFLARLVALYLFKARESLK